MLQHVFIAGAPGEQLMVLITCKLQSAMRTDLDFISNSLDSSQFMFK